MKKLLQLACVLVLGYIEDNIRKGVDCEGVPFQYSTRPFYRPFDPVLYQKMGGKFTRRKGSGAHSGDSVRGVTNTEETSKLFKIINKNGKLGMIIMGYDAFKKTVYPEAYPKFLTVSGKLLRSMKITSVSDTEGIIGFVGQRNQDIAAWLNIEGAGKGKKLWKFLGITKAQEEHLRADLSVEFRNYVIEELGKIIKK